MHAAVVLDTGQPPRYTDFPDPVVEEGFVEAEVLAAAVHVIVRSIAAGQHYSAASTPPFVPGIDGIVRMPDGRRVYAGGVRPPWGTLAERVALPSGAGVAVPDDLPDATAAALVNPAGSSWVPLTRLGAQGTTVLVVGATGTSGLLAVQAAKALGAARVVALGRNAEGLARAGALGADATIRTGDDVGDLAGPLAAAAGPTEGYDIVLDYLWGPVAAAVLAGLAANRVDPHRPVRWVSIGSLAGADLALPSTLLRSAAIHLTGHGIGSWPMELFPPAVAAMFDAAVAGHLSVEVVEAPLAEVEAAWDRRGRLVLRP